MTFGSVKEMTDALKPAVAVLTDRVSVTNAAAVSSEQIDRLAWTAVFGKDAELRGTARWIIRNLAAAAGIRPASIHDLYLAMGRGEAAGFTVPAINVRAMAYDTARAVVRSARKLNAGAFVFEIARSEIGYTEQRPHEYAAVLLVAALREGFTGPLFIQGDHVQTNAKKYNSPDRDKELEALRALIKEEIEAGFYNIDIDTSTLVDLTKPTLDEQQEVNVKLAVDFALFIRQHEPQGLTISVGGEIGEVGGKNSDVHELHAYMTGFNSELAKRNPSALGISKISVQTGTAHGGFVNADGAFGTDVRDRSEDAGRLSPGPRDAASAGAVQHGAHAAARAFDAFRSRRARSIWRPTFRAWSTTIQGSRRISRPRYAWIQGERGRGTKPKDTKSSSFTKPARRRSARSKGQMWGMRRRAIGAAIGRVARSGSRSDAEAQHQGQRAGRVAWCPCRPSRSIREAGSPPPAANHRSGAKAEGLAVETFASAEAFSFAAAALKRAALLLRDWMEQAGQVIAKTLVSAAEREVVPGSTPVRTARRRDHSSSPPACRRPPSRRRRRSPGPGPRTSRC